MPRVKHQREFTWFRLWVNESYSLRQLASLSGHSFSKLREIQNYWLAQEPPERNDYSEFKWALFDGTYFAKRGCLIVLMTSRTNTVIASRYVSKENYDNVAVLLKDLKIKGLALRAVTLDGHKHVIRAFQDTWKEVTVQRCLYHIQRQGLSWLRTYPKTQAGQELRELLIGFVPMNTEQQRDYFLNRYSAWRNRWWSFVKGLPWTSVAFIDLKRTMSLIENALPNMFHYLNDANVSATTNRLESFYSRLKADLQKHRGLSERNRVRFLKWYCYLKGHKTATLLWH